MAVLVACLGVLSITSAADTESVFTEAEWQTRTPEQVGLGSAKLDEFREIVGGRGCIVRDGFLVYHWGPYDQPHDIASAIKPLYSFLLMKAIEDGRLDDVEHSVIDFLPNHAALRQHQSHKDLDLTFRHLGYQTACLGFAESPGAAFDYNDGTMGMFWDALIVGVYDTPWDQAEARVIRPLLSGPLGFEDGTPNVLQRNTGRFAVSARDFCRFGLMMWHKGRWRDKQLIRADLAEKLISEPLPLTIPRTAGVPAETILPVRSIGGRGNQCDHNGGYSWLWWLNRRARDGRLWFPEAPDDLFACFGHGGAEGMAVLPSQRIVVSWIGNELHQDRERGSRAFSTLASAASGE
ncbi:MAG: serine hydrolase [Planctomycetales bacterium]|nr:serine hydrolase [Planctomycetales bacterium]